MKKSIGIDVSMNTVDVVRYDGKFTKNTQYKNTVEGFQKLEDEISKGDTSETIITMEATGIYHLQAAYYFSEKGYTVSVVNPLIIKRYSEMKMLRAKTDSVNARTIAEYGFHEKPWYFIQKDDGRDHIVQLLKQIDALHTMRTENKNRLHALQRIPHADTKALEIYQEIDTMLKRKEQEAEQRIDTIANELYADVYKRLLAIPGVGKRLASLILGFFGEFENFSNAKQVSSFIGLNPSANQSGVSVHGRGVISKKGNRYMRKIFYMAALSAKEYNKTCREQYNRLISNGKCKKVALVAVANKLARQIFAIVKNGMIYDPWYQKI